MMKRIVSIFGISVFVLTWTSCQRETLAPEGEGLTGRPISFSLSTETLPAETKTEYSGEVFNSYERINWTVGDQVRLFTDNTSAQGNSSWGGNSNVGVMTDYQVDGVIPSDAKSYASISPCGSQKNLAWGSGAHNIFGVYPSPEISSITVSNQGSLSFSRMTLDGGDAALSFTEGKATVQAWGDGSFRNYTVTPNMKKAFLYSAQTVESPTTGTTLSFHPLFNAVEVSFKRADILSTALLPSGKNAADFRLSAIELTSEGKAISGQYSVSFTKGASWETASSSTSLTGSNQKKIRYTFPAYGTAVGDVSAQDNAAGMHNYDNSVYTVRFFIPYNAYGDGDKLKIRFEFLHSDGSTAFTRTLQLKNESENTWFGMNPGEKLIVNPGNAVAPARWIYVLEVEPMTSFAKNEASAATTTTSYKVKSSYRYKEGNESGTREPVKWATEINMGARDINANSDWRRISSYSPANSDKAGWISFANTSLGNGGKDVNETRSITASRFVRHVNSNNPDDFFKDAISMNVHPSRINNLSDKANAIDLSMYDLQGNPLSGMTSANCYVVSAPGWYKFPLVYGNTLKNGSPNMGAVQSYHVRHDGGAIGQPWIRASLGGDLVNDYSAALVWQDNRPECSYTGCNNRKHGVIDKLEVRMDNNMAYMYFYVPQHSIQPGNNLIALKKGGDIVWSWHIWITDQPLETKDGRYMSTLIGWIPISLQGGNGGLDVYPARSEELKIVQVTSDGQKIPEGMESNILVLQEGNVIQKLRSDRIYRYGRGVYFQYGRKDPMFPAEPTGGGNRTQDIYNANGDPLAGENDYMPSTSGDKNLAYSIKNPAQFLLGASTPFSSGAAYWSTSFKTVYDPSPIGYRVIDRFYHSTDPAQNHFFLTYAKNSSFFRIYGNDGIGYPGAYIGRDGNFYLPAMGYRQGNSSQVQGAPVSREPHNGAATVHIWSASKQYLHAELGTVPMNAGKVTYWDRDQEAQHGYPVICIVE